jgi:hypothetical protein
MKIKTITTHRHTATITDTYGEIELELEHKPSFLHEYKDPLVHFQDGKLVFAYLVDDGDDAGDPPIGEPGTCNGNLYLAGSYSASDSTIFDNPGEYHSALGLDSYGDPELGRGFDIDREVRRYDGSFSKTTCLWDLAVEKFIADKVFDNDEDKQARWVRSVVLGEGLYSRLTPLPDNWKDLIKLDDVQRDLYDDQNGVFTEEISDIAMGLYSTYWRRIAGPYVVPVSYHSERGSTSISVTSWDGDPGDLPDGVWEADKDAIENIDACVIPAGLEIQWRGALHGDGSPSTLHAVVLQGDKVLHDAGTASGSWGRAMQWIRDNYEIRATFDDIVKASERYAAPILQELQDWCDGNIWGCVVEVFKQYKLDGWQQVSEDSCWRFIGEDHALESLKDMFDQAVSAL